MVGDPARFNGTQRCTRNRQRDGKPCQAPAVRGTNPPACRKHVGRALAAVKAEVAVREEATRWGPGDTTIDPGEMLLRLVTQSATRAQIYADTIERIVAEHDGDLQRALTANTYTVTEAGDTVKTGEYIRAMTQLEAQERDRCATFAAKAVAAGLAERQVRIAERQAGQLVAVMKAILSRLGHDPTDPIVAEAMRTELRLVAGGQAA